MKKFFGEMDLNNTIAYMVQKMDGYYYSFDFHEEVTGDSAASSKAYRHYQLCKNLLNWLQTKPHQLVCQHCGSIHEVRIVGDLRHYYTLCDDCINPAWRRRKAS